MSHRRFDALRERLLRAGIAPRHVRRYLSELRDHFDDLVAEEVANGILLEAAEIRAGERLGKDETLAAALIARPGMLAFMARHPLAAFGFGSALILAAAIVAAVSLEIGFLFSYVGLTRWLDEGRRLAGAPECLKVSFSVWNWLVVYAAPLAVAGLVGALGVRQRMATFWILLGASIVCVLGGFHDVGARWSELPGRSELYANFIGPKYTHAMVIASVVRAVMNLTLVGTAYWLWSHVMKPAAK